jgi:hypothetical protein
MSKYAYDTQVNTWDDGDNPGAGSKTTDSQGLNGNFIRLSDAIKAEHTAVTGVHADTIIGKNNLKSSCCDGVTIELDATNGLQVRDEGVDKDKLNDDVADGVTLERDAVTSQLQIKAVIAGRIRASGTLKAIDDITINVNGSSELQVKDDAITAAKIIHDNNRTKIFLQLAITTTTGTDWAKSAGSALSASVGVPMPRAGSITKVSVSDNGTIFSAAFAYGTHTFAVGSQLTCNWNDGNGDVSVFPVGNPNGAQVTGVPGVIPPIHVTVELELDD